MKNTKQQVYFLCCKVTLQVRPGTGMGDDDESSFSDRIFTTIASLAFVVLATMDTSYRTGTSILVCTLAT